ncbi:MAG: SPOR domain-containing protein [Methanobacteriota archaeon]
MEGPRMNIPKTQCFFRSRERAEDFSKRFSPSVFDVSITPMDVDGGRFFRVGVGLRRLRP